MRTTALCGVWSGDVSAVRNSFVQAQLKLEQLWQGVKKLKVGKMHKNVGRLVTDLQPICRGISDSVEGADFELQAKIPTSAMTPGTREGAAKDTHARCFRLA
jgi:hypothetical protein